MPCVLCKREQDRSDEGKEYCCCICVTKIMGLSKESRRQLVDQLFLKDDKEAAEFLEAVFFGESRSRAAVKLRRRVR